MQVECPICLENLESECVTLSCKHQFHKKCINKAIWIFDDDNTTSFKLNTCPVCRNNLTCNDKRITITGKQFMTVMQNILSSDIENKEELISPIWAGYISFCDCSVDPLEAEIQITADQIYEEMVEIGSGYLWDIEEGGNNESWIIEANREYKTIIDICKRYFDFV